MLVRIYISKDELERRVVAHAEAQLAPGADPEVQVVEVKSDGAMVEFVV